MNRFDPNESNTDQRLLLAMLLATVVLLLSPYFLQWLYPDLHQSPVPVETDTGPAPTPVPETPEPLEEPPPPESAEGEPEVAPIRGDERTVAVRNTDLVLTWTTRGAALRSVQVPGYSREDGEPVELIPRSLPADVPLPLEIRTGRPEIDEELATAVYELTGVSRGEEIAAPAELRFQYRSALVEVERTVRVPAAGYEVEEQTRVSVRGRPIDHQLVLGPGIGGRPGAAAGFFTITSGDFGNPGVSYLREDSGEIERHSVGGVESNLQVGTDLRWLAFDSQYFTYAALGPPGTLSSVQLQPSSWLPPAEEGAEPEPVALLVTRATVQAGSELLLFFGPKDPDLLRMADATLPQLIDYGWFGFLVRPLLFLLRIIYDIVHNYGWAIIILTFLINLAMLPLRYKQTVSMKKMSVLQPKVKAIQERYKKLARDDPKRQEMNKEMMALYQKHGVNPLGGCLPLLIQMPFLFAFYRMLAYSIELRGAPFMLWVQDLSRPDPYYVTPIAMGATMVLQQQITPMGGDPATKRMMMFMPIMFTFLFLSVSSGLALYFLFSNVFGMGFMWLIQRWSTEEEEDKPSSKPKKNPRGRKVKARR